jgi:hypothetical protein
MNDPRTTGQPAQSAHPIHHPQTSPMTPRPQTASGMPASTMPGSAMPGAPRPLVSPRPANAPSQNLPRTGTAPVINPAAASKPADDDAISLVEDDDSDATSAAPAAPSKIKFDADLAHRTHQWKRTLSQQGTGACRVRTFHGKLSDQGCEFVDDAINVWLDAHPDINVKFVTTNVGLFDGKFKDIALVVSVWY